MIQQPYFDRLPLPTALADPGWRVQWDRGEVAASRLAAQSRIGCAGC